MRTMAILAAMAAVVASSTALAEDAYVFSPNGDSSVGAGVNTGYYMKPSSRIEVDFQYPIAPSGNVLFGAWDGDAILRAAFWNSDGKYSFILGISDGLKHYSSNLPCDTARHTAVLDAKNNCFKLLAADGTEEFSGNVPSGRECTMESAWPIVLFGSTKNAAGESNQHVSARIYSVKIYETEDDVETLVHHLVPCMKGRDAGFFDKKTKEFLYGRGKFDLVCGGDGVKTIPDDGYLQSDGSQAFNTGYYMNPTSRIEVTFQFPTELTDGFLFGAWFSDNDHGLSSGCWYNGGKYAFICADGKYNNNATSGDVLCTDTNRFTAVIDVASNICQLVRNGYVRYNRANANSCANAAAASRPTVLFGTAKNEAGEATKMVSARIYSAKIYEREANGTYTLKKDFAPYEKAGVPGFMEKVSGVFTPRGRMAAGGNVEKDEDIRCAYVENVGTPASALNLGYRANMTSRIEVDYKLLKTYGSRGIFGACKIGDLHYCLWNDSNDKISFIFQGKGRSGNQSAVVGETADNERHLAVMDFKNRALAYVTDGVTNNVAVNEGAQFNDTDVSSLPLCVFAFVTNNIETGVDMVAQSRIYAVRIYENDVLAHEFLPYTDGTTNTLRDMITGYVATKVNPATADLTVVGMGVDGEERCDITPQNALIRYGRAVTLRAAAVGAVSRYKWTLNGEAIDGGSNGELTVSWRKSETPDVYTVTPVYSILGDEIDGEPVAATVTSDPQRGLSVVIR